MSEDPRIENKHPDAPDKTTAWKLDKDGAIRSVGEIPGFGLEVQIVSPLLDFHEEMNLDSDWSVKIEVETFHDTGALYLHMGVMDFGDPQTGTLLSLTSDQRAALKKAVETGEAADAIAAQGDLAEDVLSWFEPEWLEGLNYDVICRLERRRLGIGDDDIAWEEFNLAGYSRTPMRHRRAAQIKTDLMDICVPPKDLFIWGNSPFTQDPHDGPGRG